MAAPIELKFESPTSIDGIMFAIGSVAGAGGGLIVYSSLPNPSANVDQKIADYRTQMDSTEQTLHGLPKQPSKAQISVASSLVETIGTDDERIQTLIATKPAAHDTTAKEAGIMLEGAAGTGLLFALASIAIRNLAYRHRKRQAQAFKKEVEKGLDELSVKPPEGK